MDQMGDQNWLGRRVKGHFEDLDLSLGRPELTLVEAGRRWVEQVRGRTEAQLWMFGVCDASQTSKWRHWVGVSVHH